MHVCGHVDCAVSRLQNWSDCQRGRHTQECVMCTLIHAKARRGNGTHACGGNVDCVSGHPLSTPQVSYIHYLYTGVVPMKLEVRFS